MVTSSQVLSTGVHRGLEAIRAEAMVESLVAKMDGARKKSAKDTTARSQKFER